MRNNSETIWMNNKSYDTLREKKRKRETVKKGKEKNNAIKIQRLYSKVESHILSEK